MSTRQEKTEAALRSASLLAEAMLDEIDALDPKVYDSALRVVRAGGVVELVFQFDQEESRIGLAVRAASGEKFELGHVPVKVVSNGLRH